ncbi:flagellar hook assembly protein FlgD [Edwardsiella ictaluri]|uniref:Basal-body rod modification protein FlgD n=2 Tax=Edwardsiella ictaluri TaxID=67780 RepID=C5BD43_EDWI9|nr:flagellar hook assembly protein FlgD [Edwardsiella ictaluri]ACR68538.2 basal-body rod modification protein FlgD [Edwardsiella ictaluri 93-146]ARD38036.1 flagellar basal body rod modification protein [Edwardsiella ictaluri]AVZ81147.1 flagellar hook assembly protein FlgD [Edwardsiella ictaluri]EKS7763138.1 flagellar hook assembly protein FlgD [Edwardsiella ictaluri]EKS7764945.1 flagellar hook assembly protein FlgD [Edwardsiella ictaluri]
MAISVSLNDPVDTSSPVNANSKTGLVADNGKDLQNSFLTLLVAQLRNQDPTNPLKNNELTTQLAQISTVSGIEKLNTTLGSISGQINSNQSIQATSLIGHGVMIPGKTILVGKEKDGGPVSTTPFGFELESGAQSVVVTISDRTGKVVKQIDTGGHRAGVYSYTWDGTGTDGLAVPDGAYTFSVNASNQGQQMVAQPLHFATVNGITKSGNGALLELGLSGTATLADVRQIL